MRLLLFLRLLAVSLLVSACCAGACSPYTLFLQGGALSNLSGSGAEDTQVASALAELMGARLYDPGTYMCTGGCTGDYDASKLVPGEVVSYLPADLWAEREEAPGSGTRQSGRYIMTLTLPGATLTVDADHNSTQAMLVAIRKPEAPDTSTRVVLAKCRFSGQLGGRAVDLSFEQELRATKNIGPPRL